MVSVASVTTRELDVSELDDVVELLRVALGDDPAKPKTAAAFRWKHFENPFGRSIALVAESEGRLVGLRAMMRWELTTPEGDTVRCVRAVDTATHPDMQRRGIFRRLTEEAVEVAAAQGTDLVFNTPNRQSGAGYLTMGWVEVGQIRPLVRPTRHALAGRDHPRNGGQPTVGREPDNTPIDRAPLGLRTSRTADYWTWRFKSNPSVTYRELGDEKNRGIVRMNDRRGRRELTVLETAGRPWPHIRTAASEARAHYSAAWFSPATPERAAALRSGHLPIPGTGSLTLVARPLQELTVDVSSMASWDLGIGDLELL